MQGKQGKVPMYSYLVEVLLKLNDFKRKLREWRIIEPYVTEKQKQNFICWNLYYGMVSKKFGQIRKQIMIDCLIQ
jgi:hypothetical protein